MNSHSFQLEHSPRGAEASFSLGWVVDLDRETECANPQPEAIYAGYRGAKWLSWFTPPAAMGGLLGTIALIEADNYDKKGNDTR